jgi:hypothetical protein
MTDLVGHVSHLVLLVDGLSSDLWGGCLPLLDLLLVWPRIESFLEPAFEDLSILSMRFFKLDPPWVRYTFITQCAFA